MENNLVLLFYWVRLGSQKWHTPVKQKQRHLIEKLWVHETDAELLLIILLFLWCRKLAKSTFLLVSLFGLQYVLFAFFPDRMSMLTFKIWNVIELALASSQVMIYNSTSLLYINTYIQEQSRQIYLHSTSHNTHCFKVALQ